MTKKISFKQIQDTVISYDVTEEYLVGEDTHITFYPFFSNDRLSKMFQGISKLDVDKLPDELIWDFVQFHLIKEFTHFKEDFHATDLQGQLNEMRILIDYEIDGVSIFKTIIEDIFVPDQIKKAQNQLYEGLATSQLTQRLTEQGLLQLEGMKTDNPELYQILANANNKIVNKGK